ncbi:MAG: M48 family metallopeptidase [Candidatus Sericytochromatia bacterium]|nr:M48 family metallopeptidase [Candidatus Sericytochromatia bacterium]
MARTWKGHFLDGETPLRRRVVVSLSPAGLVLSNPGDPEARVYPFEALRLLGGDGPGEVATIALAPGPTPPLVEVDDASILAALAAQAPRTGIKPPMSTGLLTTLAVGSVVGSLGALALGVGWVLPAVAERVANHVPPAWESKLGEAVAESVENNAGACPDRVKREAVQTILDRLLAHSGTPYRYRVRVVHDDSVNALAAPGGHVVVFEGLLQQMPSPEALAGVLAHEIQHVERRHVTRALLRDTATSLLLAGITGDAGGLAAAVGAAGELGQLALSRADEAEADSLGMARLKQAGLDPTGMVAAYEVLAREVPISDRAERALRFVSTHPPTRERLAAMRASAALQPSSGKPLALSHPWSVIRKPCSR